MARIADKDDIGDVIYATILELKHVMPDFSHSITSETIVFRTDNIKRIGDSHELQAFGPRVLFRPKAIVSEFLQLIQTSGLAFADLAIRPESLQQPRL